MDSMISNGSRATATSAHHHNQHHQHQHRQQEMMGMAVASLHTQEARNGKQQAQQQQAVLTSGGGSGCGERKPRPVQDQALKCPRCDSTNTKFCYYNNYSMLQPRYFCKACRRYWTQGGSLRNVPVGGGCRKNKRSSSASSDSSSSNINITQLVPGQSMVPAPTTMDFPNVLPTFMSTSFELPSRNQHLSLPFTPLSLSPTLAPDGAGATTSFLDKLPGRFLDDNSNHHGNTDLYEPTIGVSNRMGMPRSPSFGLSMMQQHHGARGDHAVATMGGGGATAATQGGHWPTWYGNNSGNVAADGLQVGHDDDHHQLTSSVFSNNSNDVMMDSNKNSSSSPSKDYSCWNNGNGGTRASPSAANSWLGGPININSGCLT